MKREYVEQFLNNDWVFVKRRNGFMYKARVMELTDVDITLLDRLSNVVVVELEDILEISHWRDNERRR